MWVSGCCEGGKTASCFHPYLLCCIVLLFGTETSNRNGFWPFFNYLDFYHFSFFYPCNLTSVSSSVKVGNQDITAAVYRTHSTAIAQVGLSYSLLTMTTPLYSILTFFPRTFFLPCIVIYPLLPPSCSKVSINVSYKHFC